MKTKKNYTNIFAVVSVTLLSLLFVNCEDDLQSVESNSTIKKETRQQKIAKMVYLDADISDPTKLNEKQKDILNQARTRIDSYIMYDKKLKIYRFRNISKGSQIKMSESLFEFFKIQMDKSNENLNELKKSKNFYVIRDSKDSKILHIFKNKEAFKSKNYSVARIQSSEPEASFGPDGNRSGVDTRWYGSDVYFSHKDLESLQYAGGGVGLYLGYAKDTPYGRYITLAAGIVGLSANYFANNDDDRGIVVHMYSITGAPVAWIEYQ